MSLSQTVGLVLTGGGARGAYQAGVLQALESIHHQMNPKGGPLFRVLSGSSAGAINVAYYATQTHDPMGGVKRLGELWANIRSQDVFESRFSSIGRIGASFILDFVTGSFQKKKQSQSLLETQPLREYLSRHLPFHLIGDNIEKGNLDALAVTATDYAAASNISFIQVKKGLKVWERSRRRSEMVDIGVEHIMASSAIPIFFPTVHLGNRFFGDGSLRNMAPLSPAIHLGAEKIISVSVRRISPPNEVVEMVKRPGMAHILGAMISAAFFDPVDADIERMQRTNSILQGMTAKELDRLNLKPIPILKIQPSKNIADIASEEAHRLPGLVRYLLGGMGSVEEASELVSYLLFEPVFCQRLIELGFNDCMQQRGEIEQFITQ